MSNILVPVSPDLHRELKIRAIEENMTLQNLASEILNAGLVAIKAAPRQAQGAPRGRRSRRTTESAS